MPQKSSDSLAIDEAHLVGWLRFNRGDDVCGPAPQRENADILGSINEEVIPLLVHIDPKHFRLLEHLMAQTAEVRPGYETRRKDEDEAPARFEPLEPPQ